MRRSMWLMWVNWLVILLKLLLMNLVFTYHSLIKFDLLLPLLLVRIYWRLLVSVIVYLDTWALTQKWWLMKWRLGLDHKPELLHVSSFRWELFRIILEESIILHYPLFDLVDCFGRLTLVNLELFDTSLFQSCNEFLAVFCYFTWEISPLNLRVKKSLLRKLFLFLESN